MVGKLELRLLQLVLQVAQHILHLGVATEVDTFQLRTGVFPVLVLLQEVEILLQLLLCLEELVDSVPGLSTYFVYSKGR